MNCSSCGSTSTVLRKGITPEWFGNPPLCWSCNSKKINAFKKNNSVYAAKVSKQFKGKSISEKTKRNLSESRKGKGNPSWKGGRVIDSWGYVLVLVFVPKLGRNDYVKEHRLVWEQHNKASLLHWAHVHHVNGIKDDNRIENLEAMTNRQHIKHHHNIRK